ncbi:MAG TPA: hypothetical protein DDY38_04275 [Firmicutes bacterium]|jgi:multicomponent Na+:H+ antiporter subunit G|nr:hypothetical protein [Bacillota bacterium]
MGFLDIGIILLLVGGIFFFGAGTLGLWRLPDVYCRIQAAAKCDTLGCLLVFLGLGIGLGFTWSTFKLLLIAVLVVITNATAAHAMAKAAIPESMAEGSCKWNYQGKGE